MPFSFVSIFETFMKENKTKTLVTDANHAHGLRGGGIMIFFCVATNVYNLTRVTTILIFADKVNAEGIRRGFTISSSIDGTLSRNFPLQTNCNIVPRTLRRQCGSCAKCCYNHDSIKLDQLIGKYSAEQKDMLICVQFRMHIFSTLCILYLTLYVNTQKINFSELGLRILWKKM